MKRMALIDDDRDFVRAVRLAFEREDFAVEWFPTAATGLAAITSRRFDLVLIDSSLPDAIAVCRSVSIPIIAFAAQATEEDRVATLESGADDHLSKPPNMRELVARVRAVLRRGRQIEAAPQYSDSALTIDIGASLVIRDGKRIPLSRGEADVLALLLRASPAVLSVEQIRTELSAPARPLTRTTIDARIKSLRRKIGRERIETRTGFGYAFVGDQNELRAVAPGA